MEPGHPSQSLPEWSAAYQAATLPPVSQLLMEEAEAWRALLRLHTGVVSTARKLSEVCIQDDPTLATSRESIETREAGYYASLTQLAAQCDQLSAEALRLRALRKTRAATDTHALAALMAAHATETLLVGTTLAANSSGSVQAATVELRRALHSTRQQISQVRALLGVLQDKPELGMQLRIAVHPDSGEVQTFTMDDLFGAAYRHGPELNDETLAAAIRSLCAQRNAPTGTVAADPPATAGSHARASVRRQADSR